MHPFYCQVWAHYRFINGIEPCHPQNTTLSASRAKSCRFSIVVGIYVWLRQTPNILSPPHQNHPTRTTYYTKSTTIRNNQRLFYTRSICIFSYFESSGFIKIPRSRHISDFFAVTLLSWDGVLLLLVRWCQWRQAKPNTHTNMRRNRNKQKKD